MVLARLCKTHTYPVWGMTMLRQIRSTGPMRAPCFRGLSPGHFMLNVYWVLFLCVPDTLAAPCVTCFGFQPGCTFETALSAGSKGNISTIDFSDDVPGAEFILTPPPAVAAALGLRPAISSPTFVMGLSFPTFVLGQPLPCCACCSLVHWICTTISRNNSRWSVSC